jgi:hypothetical protein
MRNRVVGDICRSRIKAVEKTTRLLRDVLLYVVTEIGMQSSVNLYLCVNYVYSSFSTDRLAPDLVFLLQRAFA